ncbi:MAG: 4Fe-4S double cluster binding domain-containing protein [Nitrospirota bacterium]
MNKILAKKLLEAGATVIGFAGVMEALDRDIAHLGKAVSIGVDRNLNEDTVRFLGELQKKAALTLKNKGYRYLCIPPDSDRIRDTFISRLYPLFTHKIAATSAGLGWIGRNGLLINPFYGPRLSLATVLTDAPLEVSSPVEFSMCGNCRLCVEFCPSEAITGKDWSRFDPFVELVRQEHCIAYKKNMKSVNGKPNCGFCINICPFGRKQYKQSSDHFIRH